MKVVDVILRSDGMFQCHQSMIDAGTTRIWGWRGWAADKGNRGKAK
jgi:hypothetical protein